MAVALPEAVPTGRRRRRYPWATIIPAVTVVLLVGGAFLGPLWTPDGDKINLLAGRLPLLSPGHPLGTDSFGRDLLARVLEGGRVSLIVGFSSVLVCLVVGGGLGMVAGYRSGLLDTVIMRSMDVVLAFPSLVLALTIAAFLGPNLRNVVLAVAFTQVAHYARLGRAVTISVRERDFVTGARLLGAGHGHIVTRHILPNVVTPLVTYGLLAVGVAIIVEASLSFLGLGVQPPTPSWGAMIAEGRADLGRAPHIALIPGAALFLTLLSFNLLADSLRSKTASAGGGD